ncbi:ArsC family reductase [Thalassolituus sp. 59MF3M-4]|uniref:ArsC family reductase n=2 Tax=Thalassolituus pacificus TaxID=2975440 RepID=A0A9X2WE48_9GAMM|nr:ArsC family reductase [Thalassolituus pacificus]
MVTMYGIKNCDTIKKARKWLEDAGVDYQFHDYKKDGLSAELLDGWIRELGYEALLNKRGTTWRKLPDDIKDNIDEQSARAVMLDNPSIIKRPLLDTGSAKVLGFSVTEYTELKF